MGNGGGDGKSGGRANESGNESMNGGGAMKISELDDEGKEERTTSLTTTMSCTGLTVKVL
jgi:hypothetical protein